MKSEVESVVLSVAALGQRDRACVRAATLLDRSRLRNRWRVTELDTRANCRFIPPARHASGSEGSIELLDPSGDGILLVELDWPLTEMRVIQALNQISENYLSVLVGGEQASSRKSWLSAILGGAFAPRVAERRRNPAGIKTDQRAAISSHLVRFGVKPQVPRLNVVLVGSPGSGKTTAIHSVSSSAAQSTEVAATDGVGMIKAKTTIALDYGECEAGLHSLRLFGTPGQLRFAHMVEQTLRSCDGALMLVDMTSPDPVEDARRYSSLLAEFGHGGRPLLAGLTHLDKGSMPRGFHEQLAQALAFQPPTVPLDPRDHASVLRALTVLAGSCRPQ